MLSQHAKQLTLPIKEPAKAQNDRKGEGRDFHLSSEHPRDFSGSLLWPFGKPLNISSLDQQQSKGLDIPPGVRLASIKARG